MLLILLKTFNQHLLAQVFQKLHVIHVEIEFKTDLVPLNKISDRFDILKFEISSHIREISSEVEKSGKLVM